MTGIKTETEQAALVITSRRFWSALGLVLTVLGVSPFLAAKWAISTVVRDEVRDQVTIHNTDALAHAHQFEQFMRITAASERDAGSKERDSIIEAKLDKLATQIQQLREDVAVIKSTGAKR